MLEQTIKVTSNIVIGAGADITKQVLVEHKSLNEVNYGQSLFYGSLGAIIDEKVKKPFNITPNTSRIFRAGNDVYNNIVEHLGEEVLTPPKRKHKDFMEDNRPKVDHTGHKIPITSRFAN